MRTVAVVEDDPALLLGLTEKLGMEGFKVVSAKDGEAALVLLGSVVPDILVLDLMLPKIDGFEVCRAFRRRYPEIPVLILSARGQEEDKVKGLTLGADDYMTKPFGLRELLARIEALLRRTSGSGEFRFGKVAVNLDTGDVRRGKARVELSRTEYDLLRFFIRNRGRVLSRERILDGVWGYDAAIAPRTIDFHVMGLRRKLEDDPAAPRHFLTAPTLGYRFEGGDG